ncbi:MAG: amidohydrolase family protein [Planctomycetota bacterium]|nr:amidohydrolase family protein [Planctomycetota bacterium]
MILTGRLLLDPATHPPMGWLRLEGDRIAGLGEGRPAAPADLGDEDTLIAPGFIDAHLHLPQVDVIGCDGMPLLDWLEKVIYPAEQEWADLDAAEAQAKTASRRLLRAGTLGYAGYLTSHLHGLVAAIRAGYEIPLRAVAGQSLMDRNAPAALLGQDPARLAVSRRARLAASVNPRFAVSCSDELLARAGRRARRGAIVQTHLAESPRECELVRELFPHAPHYTGVYDAAGLLTERTLLAHCLHLSDEEWRLIAQRRAVVVHCPAANTFLGSGLFDLDAARGHGVRLALGSDVAAGPDLAMPRVARAMIETAKMRRLTIAPEAHVPSPAEAWRLITTGNADALGWSDAGRLEIGAAADLLLLRPPFPLDEHLIGRLIYTWRDEYIAHRIVAGRRMG